MTRITGITAIVVAQMLASGCASMSGKAADEGKAPINGGEQVADLYEGNPEVVFATEFPVDSAEDAVVRADNALMQGDTDLALYMYVRAYDLQRDNVHALMRIGQIHEARGNSNLSRRAYASVLRVEPTHAQALQSLGLNYLQAKQYGEALSLLERAVAVEPALWRAQNGIGIIADMRGQHDKAIRSYDDALDANPDDAMLLNNRGYSHYLVGDYLQATRDFSAAAGKGAKRAWLNLGLVLARQGQYDQAVQMMSRTVAREVAYNDVGYIAMRQGELDLAETYFRQAIHLAPRYFGEAQRNLTEVMQDAASGAALVQSPTGISDEG